MVPVRPRDIHPLPRATLERRVEMYSRFIAKLEAQPECDQQELDDLYELLERTLQQINGSAPV